MLREGHNKWPLISISLKPESWFAGATRAIHVFWSINGRCLSGVGKAAVNGVYRVLTFSHDKGQDDGGYAAIFDFHYRFNCFSSFNHCKSCMFLRHRGSLSVVAICPFYFLALSPAVFRRCCSISRIPANLLLARAQKLMQCGFSNVRFWHVADMYARQCPLWANSGHCRLA